MVKKTQRIGGKKFHFLAFSHPDWFLPYVQYTKNQAVKKWLSFELICAVYLEFIVTMNFARPYQNLLTLHDKYIKNQAVKKWHPYELICTAY